MLNNSVEFNILIVVLSSIYQSLLTVKILKECPPYFSLIITTYFVKEIPRAFSQRLNQVTDQAQNSAIVRHKTRP